MPEAIRKQDVSQWEQVKARYWTEYLSCETEGAKNEVIIRFLKDHPQAIHIEFILTKVAHWIEQRDFDWLEKLQNTRGKRRSIVEAENTDLFIIDEVFRLWVESGECRTQGEAFEVVGRRLGLALETIRNRHSKATKRKPRFFYEEMPDGSFSFGYAPTKIEIESTDGKVLKVFGSWRFESRPGALLK